MRIGIFVDDYLPSVHGVATSTANLKEALEKLGHDVYIIAPKCKGYEDNDKNIIRMPSSKNYVFDKREMGVIYPGLARRLDKYKFDIVHSRFKKNWLQLLTSGGNRSGQVKYFLPAPGGNNCFHFLV